MGCHGLSNTASWHGGTRYDARGRRLLPRPGIRSLPAIQIDQLYYSYPSPLPGGAPIEVLRGVDLTVESGEFLSLMGPTGAGKSTLCMALNGLVPQTTGGSIGGQVAVLGRDPRRTPVAEMAMHVALVFQDSEAQLFTSTVEEELAFGMENLGIAPEEMDRRIEWALQVVNLAGCRFRSPVELSGGQKQRVAIAAGLVMLPQVLVLDEPTSGLDPVGQFEVLGAIAQLRRELHTTVVMVSQDAEQVADFADRVAILSEGRIARHDEPLAIFQDARFMDEVGLAVPQVTRVGVTLNADLSSSFSFCTLDAAALALSQDLVSNAATP
jgi:energy-coupling factor transporter ATP-binding protein EcfA2